jgi:predicted nuclease with TOPRIM domain
LHSPIIHIFRLEYLEVENKNLKDGTEVLKNENYQIKKRVALLNQKFDEAERKLEVYCLKSVFFFLLF